jgi:hypothetical protein
LEKDDLEWQLVVEVEGGASEERVETMADGLLLCQGRVLVIWVRGVGQNVVHPRIEVVVRGVVADPQVDLTVDGGLGVVILNQGWTLIVVVMTRVRLLHLREPTARNESPHGVCTGEAEVAEVK